MTPRRIPPRPRGRAQVRACDASRLILDHFDRYSCQFHQLTSLAMKRFEKRQWRLARQDVVQRMNLYDKALEGACRELSRLLGSDVTSTLLWTRVKSAFADSVAGRPDIDITETFFNSITRKILQTIGLNREVEFFHLEPRATRAAAPEAVYRRFERDAQTTTDMIRRILESFGFDTRYEDLARDAARVADECDLHVWPMAEEGAANHIDMIRAPFFRNRVAYLVGRLVTGKTARPFIMPIYNGPRGIYVDAALFQERQASILFSFANNSFFVDIEDHVELIAFLRSILPQKPIADLYIAIGYNKHGKTEFYRYLHHFVHESPQGFRIAPGQEGSVMIGFTLPDFRFVFKVVKDRPCYLRSSDRPAKSMGRQEVMQRYHDVRYHDFVGRLVDTQEFENLRFKRKRFARALLHEFRRAATEAVTIEDDYVTIHHCYLQRRVVPLPMYLASEPDPEIVRGIILDFGYCLKDLASVGVFPGDLFNIWNCGVTSRRRVVLFDHDDVTSLRQIHFRTKPPPRTDWEELQLDEDRIVAGPHDFFMDEIERYLGVPARLMGVFRRVHGDLFTLRFWRQMQHRVTRGEVINIIPYDRSRRFSDRTAARSG